MRVADLFERTGVLDQPDLYDVIDRALSGADSVAAVRSRLTGALDAYCRAALAGIASLPLEVLILARAYRGATGIFRGPGASDMISGHEEAAALPPAPPDRMQIIVFASADDLAQMADPQHRTRPIEQVANTVQHELRHAIQYAKSFPDRRTLTRFPVAAKRPNVDGKRVGKRGFYDPEHTAHYLSADIEIDSMAVSAAMEFIARARREAPEARDAFLRQSLRALQSDSPTLMQYRELFARSPIFGLMRNKQAAQRSARARTQVWNRFRRLLARHLMDYLATHGE